MARVREPAVAGQFYEGSREALLDSIRDCFLHKLGPGSIPELADRGPGRLRALVSPHAGYMYSGPAAANVYAALAADGIPDIIILLGPSHHTIARRASVSLLEFWRTPLGLASVDIDLGQKLIEASSLLEEDENSHRREHSLEVQLPFLQFIYGERLPPICPICIRSHPMGALHQVIADAIMLGRDLARMLSGRRALVIASTDFSHQVAQATAERQDKLALDAILALDPEYLLHTVVNSQISMCGPVPVAIALSFCMAEAEAEKACTPSAELLRYYTSGDITGERSAVVGYAAVVIRCKGL